MENEEIGILNRSRPNSDLKEQELKNFTLHQLQLQIEELIKFELLLKELQLTFIALFFTDWKQRHPVAYRIFNKVLGDDALLYLCKIYLETLTKQPDTLSPDDKIILELLPNLELIDVLMDNGVIEDKFAALSKWEKKVLGIVGNNIDEILEIGRITGATKTRIIENPKIKAYKKREENLQKGRIQGALAQKAYAVIIKQLIMSINSDLLKHADTARWTLDQRAKYIEKKLIENKRTQINGKPYKVNTLRFFITGKD